VTQDTPITLELDDIQCSTIRPRQTPYAGQYLILRIDDRADGRELLRRLTPSVASASAAASPAGDAWVGLGLSYQGLKALGVPQASLDSFPLEFQQGMAARAEEVGDVGENNPEHWEKPLGTSEVHLAVSVTAPDRPRADQLVERARQANRDLAGVSVIYEQQCAQLPGGHEHFGFRDGIGQPAIEGSVFAGNTPREPALKAGEFILGYPDESGRVPPTPQPTVLGHNGAYMAFRKLHQNVAAFRRYLAAHATSPAQQEWVAAKMVGRWRSGAPLALAPDHDDPELGADPKRRNDFLYYDDDPHGFKVPPGSHIRRMNPRDAFKNEAVQVRRHRVLRRGMSFGPPLPEGVLEDDGVDRGVAFAFVGASLSRQFEFVQSEWINQGTFIGLPDEKDPILGTNDGTGLLTIPKQPIRQRLQGLPQFVVLRGGEYLFLPGLRALQWLADPT
jgi:Dyp-type peroxidase family